jgi:hypothetical protein
MDTYHDGGDSSELGAQKETFKNRLSEAIDRPLTLENTDTYVDDALEKVIDLVGTVVDKYDAQPGAEWQQLGEANGKEHEDAALKYFELEDVEGILRHLEDKASQFAVIGQVIAQANEASDVFVPPDSTPVPQATGSGTGMEKKGKQPKLENLLFVLMNDFDIDPDDPEAVSIVRGIVNTNMMREEPYYQVTVPGIDKVILVCQEYGNATFVFNGEWVRGQVNSNRSSENQPARPLTDYTKEELSKLIKDNPGQGARILTKKNFTANLVNALKGGFSQQKLDKPVDTRYLRSSRSSKDLPPVPDGYVTVKDMAKELGLEDGTMIARLARELAKKGKITMGVYRGEKNRRIFAFTTEDAQIIVDEKRRRTRSIPEGFVGVRDIMNETGVPKHIVRSTAEKLGLLSEAGLPIIFSRSEAKEICAAIENRQLIPEGYVPVTKFVREDQQHRGRQDVSYEDVWRAIEQLELTPVKAGKIFYLSEDEAGQVAAKVEQLVSERLAVKRHEKISLKRLSDVSGEDYGAVRRAAEKLGIIEEGGSSRGRYLSVAEQGEMIKYLEERRARRARAKGHLGGTALK